MEYSELPKNFITKGESESLFDNHYIAIDYGFNIGGDVFRYEGPIVHKTNKTELTECDLYPSKEEGVSLNNRGPYRLVFVNDGSEVYYTEDHYLSFSRVTLLQIQKVSFFWWIVFGLYNVLFGSLYFYAFKNKMITYSEFKTDINIATRGIIGFGVVFIIIFKYLQLITKKIIQNM
ncbi:MAG: ribonuclease domain-containing protein [bacterium]|nr:ribonuclease domain-containing protein [bacterium]